MNRKSIYNKLIAALLCTSFLYSCSKGTTTDTSSETTTEQTVSAIIGDKSISSVINELVTYEADDSYTDWKDENPKYIKLNGASATVEGSGVEVKDGTVTITEAGVYVLSGELDDGQIVVDVEDKGTVRLVLNGVEISNSNNAAIYSKNAGKTIVSLGDGTENILTDGKEYKDVSSDDEPSAALFSKDDLTINGTGKLIVNGNYNDGITSKDDLKITGGNIEVTSVDDGIIGRDLLAVKDGNITINASGDGIKATNDEDTSKGLVTIENGTFNIKAESDGIQAETYVLINDGEFNITAGGGSLNGVTKTNNDMGAPTGQKNSAATETEEDTGSTKGIKASGEIGIGGGTFNIDSADDSIHSNNSIVVNGGDLTITSGDDGMHSDTSMVINNGKINITKSYEGIESSDITINDGDINVVASDDGVNVAGGNDGSSMNGRPGQNNFSSTSSDNKLTINGGYVMINASGDGLDSNGSMYMTGGTVIVSGPTNNGNGSLDYDGTFDMTGGYLIAYGSSGMAQTTSDSSTQNSVIMTYSNTQAAGTMVHLQDSDGNTIATIKPNKAYQSIVISSPQLQKDKTYTLYTGGSATGTEKNGLYTDGKYTDGKYTDGTKVVDFSISSSVTWLSESGVTEAKSNQMGPGGDQQGGMKEQGVKAHQVVRNRQMGSSLQLMVRNYKIINNLLENK